MIRKIYEVDNSLEVNRTIKELMNHISRTLKKEGISIEIVDYGNKTIYINNYTDVKEANYILKTEFPEARQLGIHIIHNIGVPTLDNVVPIDAMLSEAFTGTLPTIKRISKDIDNAYDYILRDLLKMRLINQKYDKTYWGAKNNNKQLIIAINSTNDKPEFYVFTNIDKDAQDDILQVLSTDGEGSLWDGFCDDYNASTLSFWEYIQERQ